MAEPEPEVAIETDWWGEAYPEGDDDAYEGAERDQAEVAARWDCRWPDPIALQVAAQRILDQLPADRPGLNRALTITVRLETPVGVNPPSALLITPWAVERIHWARAGGGPPVRAAYALAPDAQGWVAAGQGVLLESGGRLVPVVVAWHAETGHYFVETLFADVLSFPSVAAAEAAVQGEGAVSQGRVVASRLEQPTSRRSLFRFWRTGE